MSITYYKENLPKLIEKLKKSLEQTFEVIERSIDENLQDDKLLNVLKAKKMAAEDSVWIMKRIDELEAELNGETSEEITTQSSEPVNRAKQFSKKE